MEPAQAVQQLSSHAVQQLSSTFVGSMFVLFVGCIIVAGWAFLNFVNKTFERNRDQSDKVLEALNESTKVISKNNEVMDGHSRVLETVLNRMYQEKGASQ